MQSEFRSNLIQTVRKPKKMVLFFIAILMAFTTIFSLSHSVSATSDGTWTDDKYSKVFYNDMTFAKADNSIIKGLPKEAQGKNIYSYSINTDSGQTYYVLKIDELKDSTSGEYFEVEFNKLGNGKIKSGPEKMKISGIDESKGGSGKESCAVEGGLGWAICPLTNTLAGMMDEIYKILQNFLDVQPLRSDNESAVFQVWNYMRNIANVLFIILFIVVIYSQITNVGISNYGIKKMLPKLIIAAILINLSYYICSILVDLSNISGHQLQNLLVEIRKSIFENSNNTISGSTNINETATWTSVATAALGTGGVIAYAGITATLYGGLGTTFLILASLVSVVFSALVALIILAARQAIITVLVFLAPLAFAANILPNTEKWFEKWKDLLSTMLIMYPIFALLFGGAQLAGTTIIYGANGNAIVMVLGMVVQVIPLVLTPFLIRLSGSLLGKFAGMINNPNKGPFDMARNAAKTQADFMRQRSVEKGLRGNQLNRKGKPRFRPTTWANQVAYNRSQKLSRQKSLTEDSQAAEFKKQDAKYIERAKDAQSAAARDYLLGKSYQFREADISAKLTVSEEATKDAISGIKAQIAKEVLEVNARGNVTGVNQDKIDNLNRNLGHYSASMFETMNAANAYKLANANNEALVTSSLAETLKDKNGNIYQDISAGERGETGKIASLASAMSASAKIKKDEDDSLEKLAKDGKFTREMAVEILAGKDATLANDIKLSAKSSSVRTLAAKKALSSFGYEDKIKDSNGNEVRVISSILNRLSTDLEDVRLDATETFQSVKKGDFQTLGGAFFESLALGKVKDFQKEYYGSLKKMSADNMVQTDPDIWKDITNIITKRGGDFGLRDEKGRPNNDDQLNAIKESIIQISKSQEMQNKLKGVQLDSYKQLVKFYGIENI